MNKRLFFGVTQRAVDRLTFIMSEFSAALIALKYLRHQTKEMLNRQANIKDEELLSKFAAGSLVHWQDFRGLACGTQWELHEEFFSWTLLGASISTFEGWISDMGTVFGFGKDEMTSLQIPERFQSVVSGVHREHYSVPMRNTFYEVYGQSRKSCYSAMASMLYCFRVFKEMRNAFMHNGGHASERLVQRLSEYQRICTRTSLHTKEVPVVNTCDIGDLVAPVYRGIIGFTDILIRILVSYDSELLCTTYGESEFLKRYDRAKYSNQLLGLNKQKAGVVIGKGVKRAGFMKPRDIESLRELIIAKLS